jgi:hypothetical protein
MGKILVRNIDSERTFEMEESKFDKMQEGQHKMRLEKVESLPDKPKSEKVTQARTN